MISFVKGKTEISHTWDGDQVHMIWHQAIIPDFNPALSAPFGEQGDVGTIIGIFEECLHSPVTQLFSNKGTSIFNS